MYKSCHSESAKRRGNLPGEGWIFRHGGMNGIGPVPWPLGLWYRNVVPGDSHVALLLGMTYFFTFTIYRYPSETGTWAAGARPRPTKGTCPCTIQRGRHPSDPPGAGHLASRGGFRVVTWYHSTTGLPHHLSGLVRNDVVDGRRGIKGAVPYTFRDGGPVPYAPHFLNCPLSIVNCQL